MESPEDGSLKRPDTRPQTRPGTRPDARHEDVVSYSLPERGVEPEDGRILSGIVDKAMSRASIQWGLYLDDTIVPLPN
jgi:hypothetical protein